MAAIQVSKLVYHRNGISGLGFYTCAFTFVEDGVAERAIATIDAEDIERFQKKERHNPATRVLMISATGGIDIERAMRGDHFHEELCKHIIKANKEERASWHAGKKV